MKRIPLFLATIVSVFAALSGSALAANARTATSPTNSTLPTISGTPRSGQSLTAASGSWAGTAPISYAYQWQRCNSSGSSCNSIGGATNQNYVASNGDVGKTIRVQVTGSNSDGSNQALSAATDAVAGLGTVPANTKQPATSGKAQDGQTVTVSNGSWTGEVPMTFSYQWQSCTASAVCTDISGATGKSYLVGTTQVGSTLRATVTAANSIGKTPVASTLTAAVIAKASSPVNTALPQISGSLSVGQTLQASTGTWTGLGTTGFDYQWARCNANGTSCAGISGATGQSYGVGQVDIGNALRVNVSATNSNGTTSASSAAAVIAAKAILTARFNAVLRSNQELRRPHGISSRAAGHFTARLTGRTLSWTLTFSHLTGRPTIAGLNRGLRGTSGVAFKTLCRRCNSPSRGTLTLTASQREAILKGGTYANIRTGRNSQGEIRGQINRVS